MNVQGTKSFPKGEISVMIRSLEEMKKPNGLSWSELWDLYQQELAAAGFSEAEEDYRLAMEIAQFANGGQPRMEFAEDEEDYRLALEISSKVNLNSTEED